MLSKENRLTTRLFARVFSRSKNIKTRHFLVRYSHWVAMRKVAVVVKKKDVKAASDRNRLRRQIYALARKVQLDHGKGALILIYKPASTGYDAAAIIADLQEIYAQII